MSRRLGLSNPQKESNAMTSISTPSWFPLVPSLQTAWQDVDGSFERFCLTAGIGAIEQMLREDAQQLAGAPHSRGGGRVGYRWGKTKARSASMAARSLCIARGYAALTAMKFRCRPGPRRRPRTSLATGP